MVITMPNLPGWHDVPLATLVAEALELPARLHNDASLAALGEALAGAGRGASPLVYLTVSTGIGGGIVIGGRLFEGRHGLAGELGHILLDPAGPTCGLGRAGLPGGPGQRLGPGAPGSRGHGGRRDSSRLRAAGVSD